jgi:subtilisin-like proprotein convertase family protein
MFGLLSLFAVPPMQAAVVLYSQSVNTTIPDDTSTGMARQISVSEIGTVNRVEISLSISAAAGSSAFLGDLYIYLQHDTAISVLLNRPGRRTGESFGYDDNQGLSVTFNDTGSGDIHSYRTVLLGNDTTPLTGTLNGTWQPDGRTTDPSLVLASDGTSASLSLLNGLPSQGEWRLFVADLSGGAVHQLDSWSITLDVTNVPEPRAWTAISGLALLGFALVFRRKEKESLRPNA